MSDASKQRPVIDLDELERQLRAAAGARESAQPAVTASDDPLAELARIVGQDDPYKSYWPPAPPPEKQPQRHARSQFDELLADQRYAATGYAPNSRPAEPQAVQDPYGSQESFAPQDPYVADTRQEPTEDWALRPAVSDDRRPPAFEPAYRADEGEPLYEPQGQLPPHERSFEQQAAESPRKKGWLITGALMSVAVVGLAGAVLWRSPSAMKVASGTPPLIKADTSPAKVVPENPGGIEVPNQDRQIYAKGTQEDIKGVKLTGGAEQPIDVNQVARKDVPSASPLASTSTSPAATTASVATVPGLGEARRVKTVSVRPDGTIIDHAGGPEPLVAPARVASLAPTNVEIPAPASGVATSGGTTSPTPTPRPKPVVLPAMTLPTATATTPAKPAPAVPVASATPSETTPKPAPAKPAQVAALSTAEDPAGSFAVQLAAPGTEQEARDTSSRLEKRFTAELGGLKPAIRKADVNGKTIYRIRVGGLSREDANALCTKLQGSGGQCFVAKN